MVESAGEEAEELTAGLPGRPAGREGTVGSNGKSHALLGPPVPWPDPAGICIPHSRVQNNAPGLQGYRRSPTRPPGKAWDTLDISMRGTRWLLILAILAILGGIGATYRLQRRILATQAAPKPARMPLDLKSSAEDWVWS